MNANDLRNDLEAALDGVRLLEHPFYVRWQNGLLADEELTAYAEQYRHFEAALPGILQDIVDSMPEGDARRSIEDNLADEAGTNGIPAHVELFDGFVTAVGGDASAPATPATRALLDTYAEVVNEGPARAIGGLVAYEIQAPAIAKSKGDGLREHHGLDAKATRFWDVHATLDIEHADWTVDALAQATPDSERADVVAATRKVAEAWYAFLDEREAAAPAGACAC